MESRCFILMQFFIVLFYQLMARVTCNCLVSIRNSPIIYNVTSTTIVSGIFSMNMCNPFSCWTDGQPPSSGSNNYPCILCQNPGSGLHYCFGYDWLPEYTILPDEYSDYSGFMGQYSGTFIGCPGGAQENRTVVVYVLCDQPTTSLSLIHENPICNYVYELRLQSCQLGGGAPSFQVRSLTSNTIGISFEVPAGVVNPTYQVYLNDEMVYTGIDSDTEIQNLGAGSTYDVSVSAVYNNGFQTPKSTSLTVQTLTGKVASRESVYAEAAAKSSNSLNGIGVGIGIGFGVGIFVTILVVLLSIRFLSPVLFSYYQHAGPS